LGGGLVDMGGYVGFSASHPAMEYNGIKENYDNLKTQCYYRIAKRVNEHQISVSLEDCLVDGLQTKEVIIKNKPYDIQALLKKQLRIMKMKNIDKDGKRCMNNKEEQKNALG
jgi:hypothetical protein